MYIKVNNKKIKIKELNKFTERFKSFKFYLETIDYGIRLPKKKMINTTFFCQKIDVIVTDKKEKILYLYEDLRSEKRKFHLKNYNIYYMPINTVKYFKVGDTLKLYEENKKDI